MQHDCRDDHYDRERRAGEDRGAASENKSFEGARSNPPISACTRWNGPSTWFPAAFSPLDKAVPHDLQALEDSALLFMIAWPGREGTPVDSTEFATRNS